MGVVVWGIDGAGLLPLVLLFSRIHGVASCQKVELERT